VESNRKEAMLARQRVNFKLEEELTQIRAKQQEALSAYRERQRVEQEE
jgi:hypothetical protein